jgi:hypothetical protein
LSTHFSGLIDVNLAYVYLIMSVNRLQCRYKRMQQVRQTLNFPHDAAKNICKLTFARQNASQPVHFT